jgi:type III secretory pathway component EscS
MATLLCNLTLALILLTLGQPICAAIVVVAGGLTVLAQAATDEDDDAAE